MLGCFAADLVRCTHQCPWLLKTFQENWPVSIYNQQSINEKKVMKSLEELVLVVLFQYNGIKELHLAWGTRFRFEHSATLRLVHLDVEGTVILLQILSVLFSSGMEWEVLWRSSVVFTVPLTWAHPGGFSRDLECFLEDIHLRYQGDSSCAISWRNTIPYSMG